MENERGWTHAILTNRMDIYVHSRADCVKMFSPSPSANIVFDYLDRLKREFESEIGEKGGGSGVLSNE